MSSPEVILETLADDRKEAQREALEDQEKPSFKVARALLNLAKTKSSSFRSSFERDWAFLLGENHNQVPKNSIAAARQRNKNQGVRNWLYATCDQKAQMILGGKAQYTAEPYGAPVDFVSRWRAQEAVQEQHRRMETELYDEDVLWDGMATGKGYNRILVKADPRSGLPLFELETLDPAIVFPDPAATRLRDCDHLHIEPWMTAAQIRQAFPNTWMKVRMEEIPVTDSDSKTRYGRSRTDAEILMGQGGHEFVYNKSGQMCELGARIAFSWYRNEEVENEMQDRLVHGEREGFACAGCGDVFDHPHMEPPDLELGMDAEEAIPAAPRCPVCGSDALAPIVIPAQIDHTITGRKFRYPYGYLVVTCAEGILWEGPNPDHLDEIFPIYEYHHHRVSRRFFGLGEVAKLRTAQVNANKNMQQLMDYLRTAVNGVLEYPNRATTYGALSNSPNAKIPLPINLIGLARYLPPAPFNLQAFITAEETIRRDFQEMGGITDVVYGLAPSAPTSGKEVEARRGAATTRIDGHIDRFSQFRSARATGIWQLMWQHMRSPKYFPIRNSMGQPDMTVLTINTLPRHLKMRVTSEIQKHEQSELKKQAVQQLMLQGLVPMALDILLPTMGLETWEAQTLMDRALLRSHEQSLVAQAEDPSLEEEPPTDLPPAEAAFAGDSAV